MSRPETSGVVYTRHIWSDEYMGTPAALIAAGLVQQHQLPGVGENGKTMVSFAADGSRIRMGNTTACRQAGYIKIRTASRGCFLVERGIGEAEVRRRRAEHDREATARKASARCWPFPIVCGEPV